MGQLILRRSWRRWWRSLAAGAIALTLGLGQAQAEINNFHEGGQGRDKQSSAFTGEKRFGGEAGVQAFAAARVAAPDSVVEQAAEPAPTEQATDPAAVEQGAVEQAAVEQAAEPAAVEPEAVAAADAEEDAAPKTRTRTATRTFVKDGFVVSRTRSKSISFDEEGNRAVARAVARARAPNDVAAVEAGAGRIVAKTSVDITGNGTGSAAAGGSIGTSGGKVDVSTWGKTSAEVH